MFKKRYIFFILVILSLILIGCNDKKGNIETNVSKVKFPIPETLIVDNKTNSFYSIDNHRLKSIDSLPKERILGFTKNNLITIVEEKNNENIILYKDNKEIKTSFNGNLEYFNSNKDASKAIYKLQIKDEEYEYGIVNLLTSKQEKIDMDVAVSGKLIEFIDNSNVIFYGASKTEKISGIYKYNIDNKTAKLIKEIDNGFITYIKAVNENKFIYLLTDFNDKKITLKYDMNTNSEELISKDVLKIKNIVTYNDKMFMLGTFKNNVFSLYEIRENKVNRLVYDFPKGINEDSNIILDNENIIFEGYDKNQEENNIFAYNVVDKSTSILSSKDGKYEIIKKSDKY